MTDAFYTTLQEEVGEWSQENFGDQPSTLPALGVAEELGELAYSTQSEGRDETIDAIGDVIVYLADVCARRNLQLGEWRSYVPDDRPLWDSHFKELLYTQSLLTHAVLKDAQGIRESDETTGYAAEMKGVALTMHCLNRLADHYHLNLYECVEFAWGEVSGRAWDADIKESTDAN